MRTNAINKLRRTAVNAVLLALSAASAQAAPEPQPAAKELRGETSQPRRNKFKIIQTEDATKVQQILAPQGQGGWTGGDAAYSVPLPNGSSVWLFGDSLIGKIKGDKRVDARMVHNAIAVESGGKTRFYWGQESADKIKRRQVGNQFGFFGKAPDKDCYFWPGDAFLANGKLYVFLHAVRTNYKKKAPFQFEMITDYLAEIQNPLAEPSQWRISKHCLDNHAGWLLMGVATLQDGEYLYIYSADSGYPLFGSLNQNPTILGRISKANLSNFKAADVEWFGQNPEHPWGTNYHQAQIIIPDGASEMSVVRINGIPKELFVFYITSKMDAVWMRHAQKPQGPWSEAVRVLALPNAPADRFYYSAKAHPQYSEQKNTVVVTYCTNTKLWGKLFSESGVYIPRALRVKLGAADKSILPVK